MFNGKPIISYVIDTVKKSSLFDEVMVSTDNIEIAEVAKKIWCTSSFFEKFQKCK